MNDSHTIQMDVETYVEEPAMPMNDVLAVRDIDGAGTYP